MSSKLESKEDLTRNLLQKQLGLFKLNEHLKIENRKRDNENSALRRKFKEAMKKTEVLSDQVESVQCYFTEFRENLSKFHLEKIV